MGGLAGRALLLVSGRARAARSEFFQCSLSSSLPLSFPVLSRFSLVQLSLARSLEFRERDRQTRRGSMKERDKREREKKKKRENVLGKTGFADNAPLSASLRIPCQRLQVPFLPRYGVLSH